MNLFDVKNYLKIPENSKNLVIKEHPELPLSLVCYTANAFQNWVWDEFTLNNRGTVYHSETGKQLNNPMQKMFNVDEDESTKLCVIHDKIYEGNFELMDKANGHCCFLFKYEDKWINHTKASWDFEFIEKDREIIQPFIDKLIEFDDTVTNQSTFMFEIIADYDKHTMYEQQVEQYGDNVAVLITARYNPTYFESTYYTEHELEDIVQITKGTVQLVKFLSHEEPLYQMYEDKGIEGYVFRFKDGSAVKVKTNEYKFLRYMKTYESGKFFEQFFNGSGKDPKALIPEEYFPLWVAIEGAYNTIHDAILSGKDNLVNALSVLPRKEAATLVKQHFAGTHLGSISTGIVFSLLDGKCIKRHVNKIFLSEFDFEGFVNDYLNPEDVIQ